MKKAGDRGFSCLLHYTSGSLLDVLFEFPAIFVWCGAFYPFENVCKVRHSIKSNGFGYLGNGHVIFPQQHD